MFMMMMMMTMMMIGSIIPELSYTQSVRRDPICG